MHALVSNVCSCDHEIGWQRPLNIQRPVDLIGNILLSERAFHGIPNIYSQSSRIAGRRRKTGRKRVAELKARERSLFIRFRVDRRGGADSAISIRELLPSGGRMTKDTKSRMDNRLVVEAVGNTNTRI